MCFCCTIWKPWVDTICIQLLKTQSFNLPSQVAKEHIKGYIYIEAFKQTHVKQVIEGVGNLRMGRWKQHMVPIKEMTDVLKVRLLILK